MTWYMFWKIKKHKTLQKFNNITSSQCSDEYVVFVVFCVNALYIYSVVW